MRGTLSQRTAALAAAGAVALLPAAAFADGASSSAVARESADSTTFTVGVLHDADSLNPFAGIQSTSYQAWSVAYDYLVGYSQKDFSPVPLLAESWQESPDHTTWTYEIRSGVRWSDGQPLTAADAAYTFNRIINGAKSGEQTNYASYVADITKAEAPDATTLILTVSKPTPIMTQLAVPILPEHIWENISEKDTLSATNEPVVGSGPFVFDRHVTGQYISFHANPSYFSGAPHIKNLVFRVFPSEDSLVAALKDGEIDFADNLSLSSFKSLQNVTGVATVPAEYSGFDDLAFNTGAATDAGVPIGDGSPILKDKRVRQAINYAIDRDLLVSKVLNGYGQVGTSVIPDIYAGTHYDPGSDNRGFDIGKANKILDDAGYTAGSDGIRVDPSSGKRLSFRLFARDDSTESQESVHYIQGWLKQIGIEADVQIVSENRLTELIGNGDYDMFEWQWVVEPDPDYQLSTFLCSSRSHRNGATLATGLSDSFYCNPAYDQLYTKQSTTTDPKARAGIVRQMEKLLYDDAPYVVTYYYANLEAYRSDRFANFRPQPDPDGSLLSPYGTYSYRSITHVSQDEGSITASSAGLWAGLVAGGLVVLGLGAYLVTRSRAGPKRR